MWPFNTGLNSWLAVCKARAVCLVLGVILVALRHGSLHSSFLPGVHSSDLCSHRAVQLLSSCVNKGAVVLFWKHKEHVLPAPGSFICMLGKEPTCHGMVCSGQAWHSNK